MASEPKKSAFQLIGSPIAIATVVAGIIFGYGVLNARVSVLDGTVMDKQEIVQRFTNKQIQIDMVNCDIADIKQDLKEIKGLLMRLIKGLN